MKKFLIFLPVLLIIMVVVALQFMRNARLQRVRVRPLMDSTSSVAAKLDATIDTFNRLKPLIDQTIDKIRYYEQLKKGYERQVNVSFKTRVDSGAIKQLQYKLNQANNEIVRLQLELNRMKSVAQPRPKTEQPRPTSPLTPDDNSVIITLDTAGLAAPKNLMVYLIPYSRKVRKYMVYEAACGNEVTQYRGANYYNGLYFFNNVETGRYLIKICTYYGNYKVIDKEFGKYVVTMQVAPPLQK